MVSVVKNNKRLFAIIILFVMLFSFSACGVDYAKDSEGVRLVNEETGSAIIENQITSDVTFTSELKDGNYFDAIFVVPLSKVITFVGEGTNSYGVAIILVTMAVRLLTMPFTLKASKQQKRMNELKPKIDKINSKYEGKSDRESQARKQQETMNVYKENNINPLGGCLGPLLTLPLFIAFYAAILRTPGTSVGSFFGLHLATNIKYGIFNESYFYVIPVILVGVMNFIAMWYQRKVQNVSRPKRPNETKAPNMVETQMKMMLYLMPIMMVFVSVNIHYAMNIYFIAGSFVMIIQSFVMKALDNKKE